MSLEVVFMHNKTIQIYFVTQKKHKAILNLLLFLQVVARKFFEFYSA